MTQEEKDLLRKDLSARYPYGVVWVTDWDEYKKKVYVRELTCVDLQPQYTLLPDIKPYLRPLSSMTEDEAIKVVELCVCSPKDVLSVSVKQDCISVEIDDGVAGSETYTIWFNEIVSSIELFDWLNEHHFDYRGLIEKGLALEAKEGMYK